MAGLGAPTESDARQGSRLAITDSRLTTSAAIRFEALDGLRTVAALAVLLYHFTRVGAPWLLPHSYLAVDFFFTLSGFVLAHAYAGRLRSGMSPLAFIRSRAIRLFPLIWLGALVGLAGYARLYHGSTRIVLLLTGLALIPTPLGAGTEGRPFLPLNPPSWSLFFEFVANLVYAFVARWLTPRWLGLGVALGAGAAFAFCLASNGAPGGPAWPNLGGGFVRVLFSFFAGAAVFELWRSGRFRRLPSSPWFIFPATALLFAPPIGTRLNGLYDGLDTVVAFPVLVLCGANCRVSGRFRRVCEIGGALSYPAYILQGGLIPHVRELPAHLHWEGLRAFAIWLPLMGVYLAFCWIALKAYDEPLRRWLTRFLRRSPGRLFAAAPRLASLIARTGTPRHS